MLKSIFKNGKSQKSLNLARAYSRVRRTREEGKSSQCVFTREEGKSNQGVFTREEGKSSQGVFTREEDEGGG